MSQQVDRLYSLLPTYVRQRDLDEGEPLRALLRVIADQVNLVEADIAQLYANWFIETCQDWVVPYIGDLIGYTPAHDAGEPGDVTTNEGRLRNKILIPRREVAQTIHFRRRKGTLALLETLARDVSGWPAARAVEFSRRLVTTSNLNATPRPRRGHAVDLHQMDALDRLAGPFDQLAHSADVRDIASHRTTGQYNLPSVGIFVWRLYAYSITQSTAHRDVNPHCFQFSILGNDAPLFTNPSSSGVGKPAAPELGLPIPIRRHTFAQHLADYYGEGKSMLIWAEDWPHRRAPQPIDVSAIVAADLTHWRYHPRSGQVAVDPELGRIAFPPGHLPRAGVRVNFYYGFSADLGGGEYDRPIGQPANATRYDVAGGTSLADVLRAWQQADPAPIHAVIEIANSAVYNERLPRIVLAKGQTLQIRAANHTRPVLRLPSDQGDDLDALQIRCAPASCFTLDGVLIAGRGVEIDGPIDVDDVDDTSTPVGDPATIIIRHSTLVPGWSLHPNCEPQRGDGASIVVSNVLAQLQIEHSIVGSIQIEQDEVRFEPIPFAISDSVLDSTSPREAALGGEDWPRAHAVLTIQRSTVFGTVDVREIALAENSIFNDLVTVSRRQNGCMRFCYCPPGSRTPRRYECQPDMVQQAVEAARTGSPQRAVARAAQAELAAAQEQEVERVRPRFNSTRYGTPAYCQLADLCAVEIKHGADDESELGVFHDLFQPQREANLRARLDEYTPAGASINVIFAN
jgi:hypothetical protein